MSNISLIPGENGVRLSTLSPKYLHTNSTSHTWPFSAIAELIDNAYDPDVDASQLWIDIEKYGFEKCITFTDNGAGMDSLKLHKMLSFGFCEKVAKNDHLPVGHYGNGFKSGSMRLGKDAIVFTKNQESQSVGFLSQTYLEKVNAQTILVPIVSWDSAENMIKRADGDKALQDIMEHSLFKTKQDLLRQFDKITSRTGTRIVISNMRKTKEGKSEFDFRSEEKDIKIPDDVEPESFRYKRQERQYHIPESDYSLRAYCSILYLKPRMQIILRGKKVKTTVITKSLSKTEVDTYKPTGVVKPVKVTFGFSQNKNHYGIMMYHRNRLIKPYVRVGYQLKANNLGVGVIGVIQCDYLQPTHNKQDFDYTKAYRTSMTSLGTKLNDYWNEKKGKHQANNAAAIPEPQEVGSHPDQLWVQCDNPECLKWRKLPQGVSPESLPEKWYCTDHPEKQWRSCEVPEELEEGDEDSVQPYVKKQKKRLEKELEEKRRKEREAKLRKELELEARAKEIKKKEAEISRLIKMVEDKSKEQQQIQNQGNVKKEVASPQKLQIKVQPAMQRQQQRTTVPHTAVTQQSVKLVKVVPAGSQGNQKNPVVINLGEVTVARPGASPKVSGAPVIIRVNNQSAAQQIKYLPTMVPVKAIVDPKVVGVTSLSKNTSTDNKIPANAVINNPPTNVSKTTNIAGIPHVNMVTIATTGVSMATPGNSIATTGNSIVTPGNSMATAGNSMVTPGSSTATPRISMATARNSMAPTMNSTAMLQVKSEPGTNNGNDLNQSTVVKSEPMSQSVPNHDTTVKSEQKSPNVSKMKRPHPNTDNDSGKKQRTETDVIVLDPPSPPTMVSLSPGASNMNEDSKIYPNTSNMVSDLPNIETSSPNKVTQEVDRIVNDCKMVNIDKDVVDEIKTMSPKQQLQALLTRSQKLKHLYALRANVYKLLKVLVPELEVGNDLKQKYDDQTVDELLTQVLEQAEKSDS